MAAIVETHRLTRVFTRSRPPKVAVDGVDLRVEHGTIYGLIGPNGAGKSTLVALLCTLVTPTSGTALVAGHDIRRDPDRVRRAISLNFGGERAFYYRLRLQQNLEFFAALHGLSRGETARRVQAALERTGLWQDRRTYYSDCSTGMKKRLNFARALMLDAPLYICDEPTTGVDVDSSAQLRAILRELRQAGRSVLLVSHNLDEVAALADSVALMHHGRIVHEDTPEGFRRLIAPREISLELSGPSEVLIAELGALPGVDAVDREDGRLRLRTAAPEQTMASVLSVVHRLGLAPTGIQVVRPDLAEVFRHLVGS